MYLVYNIFMSELILAADDEHKHRPYLTYVLIFKVKMATVEFETHTALYCEQCLIHFEYIFNHARESVIFNRKI